MEILRKIWHKWKQFGQLMGDFLARIVLTVFYFTVFMPFGIAVRLLGDPLAIKERRPEWLARSTQEHTIDNARRLS
jgi:hypothetical protein